MREQTIVQVCYFPGNLIGFTGGNSKAPFSLQMIVVFQRDLKLELLLLPQNERDPALTFVLERLGNFMALEIGSLDGYSIHDSKIDLEPCTALLPLGKPLSNLFHPA
jgi:hypothetical protein